MNTTQMTDAALAFAMKDLAEVIAIQEAWVRAEGPNACPKLGRYWDDLYAVQEEIRRRSPRR